MKLIIIGTIAALSGLPPAAALAQSGAPAKPAEPGQMADSWQLESKGQTLCVVRLSAHAGAGGVYGAQIPASCGAGLPAGVAGWKPTPEGMALVGADGSPLVTMSRWSESLYVASGPGAPDIQLARAAPH